MKIISAQFDFCVQEQDLFGSESDLKKLEQFILDEAFKSQLLNEMRKKTSSLERWNVLKDLVKHMKDRVIRKFIAFLFYLLLIFFFCLGPTSQEVSLSC